MQIIPTTSAYAARHAASQIPEHHHDAEHAVGTEPEGGVTYIQPPESETVEVTWLSVFDCLAKIVDEFRSHPPSTITSTEFELISDFILGQTDALVAELFTSSSNAFNKSELQTLQERIEKISEAIAELTPRHPELGRVNRMTRGLLLSVDKELKDQTRRYLNAKRINPDAADFLPNPGSFAKNLQAGIRLLKNEKYGLGSDNDLLNMTAFYADPEKVRQLTLTHLENLRASLAQLERDANEGNARLIQFLIQVVCAEITKRSGRNLDRLNDGLNEIGDLLAQINAGEKEYGIVENLLQTVANYQREHLHAAAQNQNLDPALLFMVSRGLTELTTLLSHSSYRSGLEPLVKIQGKISNLKTLFSIVPHGVSRNIEQTPAAIKIYQDDAKKLQDLKDALTALYGPVRNWNNSRWQSLYVELWAYVDNLDPESLEPEKWAEISYRVINVKNVLIEELERFDSRSAIADFTVKNLDRIQNICLQNITAAWRTGESTPKSEFEFDKEDLSHMMQVLQALVKFTDGLLKGTENAHIIDRVLGIVKDGKKDTLEPEQWEEIILQFDLLIYRFEQLNLAQYSESNSIDFVQKNIEMVRNLCKIGSSKSSGPTDPRSRTGFITVFREIRDAFKGYDSQTNGNEIEINSTLDAILQYITKQPRGTDFTMEAWDYISGELEKITRRPETGQKKGAIYDGFSIGYEQDSLIHNGLKIGFIKKNLDYLAFVSGVAWAKMAHKKVLDHLTMRYMQKWNPGYSFLITHTGSLSVSMPFFKVQASAGHTHGFVTDDEGYPGYLSTVNGSVGAEVSLGLDNIKIAGAGVAVQGGKGWYEEWDSARKYVLDHFQAVIEEYRHDPAVLENLNRKSTGRKEAGSADGTVVADLPRKNTAADDIPFPVQAASDEPKPATPEMQTREMRPIVEQVDISVENIDKVQSTYDLESDHIGQLFSLLIGVRTQRLPAAFSRQYVTDTPRIKLDPLKIEKGNGLKLQYHTLSGKAALTAGLQTSAVNLMGSVAATGNGARATLIRATPVCAKLRRLYYREEYNDKGEAHRIKEGTKIRKEIADKSMGLRNKFDLDAITEAWKKERNLSKSAVLTGQQTSQLDIFRKAELQRLQGASMQIWSRAPVIDVLRREALRNGAGSGARLPQVRFDAILGMEFESLNAGFAELNRDFRQYAHLQSQLSYGDKSTVYAIEAMHDRYGVTDAEHCMYRFLLLNAWLYTRATDIEELDPGRLAELNFSRDDMVDLEKKMFECRFSVDKKKLDELATFQDACDLETRDIKIGAEVRVDTPVLTVDGFGIAPKGCTISLQQRYRYHINPLRRGDYRDIEVRLSPGLHLESRSKTINYIMREITGQAGENYVPEDELFKQLDSHLNLNVSATGTVVFNFRWYKPALFPSLGYRFWNFRASVATDITASIGSPGFFVSGGYSYEQSQVRFIGEVYSSDSMLYFGLRYFHDFAIKDILESGKISELSYWNTVKAQQISALEDLFRNTGRAEESRKKPDGISRYSVIRELDCIETEIYKISKNRDQTREKISAARKEFMEKVCAYADGHNADYRKTLEAFEALMLAYSPHLITMKKKSDLFRPKSFRLEST